MSSSLGVLLISGGHERAHYAFMLAAGAAAIGREVVIFATNDGCHGLTNAASDAPREAEIEATGVPGIAILRAASAELGVRLIACESGLRMAGMDRSVLSAGVEVAGITSFLVAVGQGQIITL